MKRLTLIILSVFGLWMTISSQTSKTFNLSDFDNRKWTVAFPSDTYPIPPTQGWTFSKSGEVNTFMDCINVKKTGKVQFYLSETPETEFNHSKVGKTTQGKYIVILNKANLISNLKIISISPQLMRVKKCTQL